MTLSYQERLPDTIFVRNRQPGTVVEPVAYATVSAFCRLTLGARLKPGECKTQMDSPMTRIVD